MDTIRILFRHNIIEASKNEDLETIQLHLKLDPSKINIVDEDGMSPLHHAVMNGCYKTARSLIGYCIDLDRTDNSDRCALHYAAALGDDAMIELLLSKGANVDAKGPFNITPLHEACRTGHLNAASILIQFGANLNTTTQHNYTPLLWAAISGHDEIVKLLLRCGRDINVNAMDDTGMNALHIACMKDRLDIAVVLIRHHIEVNCHEHKCGRTPLHLSARYGYFYLMQFLIAKGANVNAVDHNCETPLHYASQKRYCDLVVYLIEKKADITVLNKEGRSALSYFSEVPKKGTKISNIVSKQAAFDLIYEDNPNHSSNKFESTRPASFSFSSFSSMSMKEKSGANTPTKTYGFSKSEKSVLPTARSNMDYSRRTRSGSNYDLNINNGDDQSNLRARSASRICQQNDNKNKKSMYDYILESSISKRLSVLTTTRDSDSTNGRDSLSSNPAIPPCETSQKSLRSTFQSASTSFRKLFASDKDNQLSPMKTLSDSPRTMNSDTTLVCTSCENEVDADPPVTFLPLTCRHSESCTHTHRSTRHSVLYRQKQLQKIQKKKQSQTGKFHEKNISLKLNSPCMVTSATN